MGSSAGRPMIRNLLWSLLFVSSIASASSYEHPLQRGGGNPSTAPDFPQKLTNYLSAMGGGVSGEELLQSYYGDRRNIAFPDLVLAFGKTDPYPVMSLWHRGKQTDRLSNEAFLYVVVFVEEGAEVLAQKPAIPDSPVTMPGDSRDVCFKEPSQFQVRLEGLAYEKEKDSGINAMEVIKLYTGKEPQRYGQRPLEGVCAAVDMTKTEPIPGTTIRKAIIKFPMEKESVYRLNVHQTGNQQSSDFHFSNIRLSLFGAGVGVGAINKQANFTRASVKPFIFAHVYVSKAFNPWNRSVAIVAGIPIENKLEEAMVGIRWSPANEWECPDVSRFGLIIGSHYRRPTGEFKDQRQWRTFVGLDYKL